MRGAAMPKRRLRSLVHDLQGREQPRRRDRPRDLGQRQVRGDERHPQRGVLQHHHGQGGTRSRREIFGVSHEIEARLDERALLYRCGDHGGEFATQAAIASPIKHGDDGSGVAGIEPAGHHRMRRRYIEEL